MPYHPTDTCWTQQESRTEDYLKWLRSAECRLSQERRAAVEAQIVLIQKKSAERKQRIAARAPSALKSKLDLL